MAKQVTKFESNDGELFDTAEAADMHDRMSGLTNELNNILYGMCGRHSPSVDTDELITELTNHKSELSRIAVTIANVQGINWPHIANEYADTAANAIQYLSNIAVAIHDGTITREYVLNARTNLLEQIAGVHQQHKGF